MTLTGNLHLEGIWKPRENEATSTGVKGDWISQFGWLDAVRDHAQSSEEGMLQCLFSFVSLLSLLAVFVCCTFTCMHSDHDGAFSRSVQNRSHSRIVLDSFTSRCVQFSQYFRSATAVSSSRSVRGYLCCGKRYSLISFTASPDNPEKRGAQLTQTTDGQKRGLNTKERTKKKHRPPEQRLAATLSFKASIIADL